MWVLTNPPPRRGVTPPGWCPLQPLNNTLIKVCATAEHVGRVGPRRVPDKLLVEAGAAGEHAIHVGDIRRVPEKVLVETSTTREHGFHADRS